MPNLLNIATIVGLVIVAFLVVLIYLKSVYKNAGPDEALIITGTRSKKTTGTDGTVTEESGIKVVHGSGVFLKPFFQKAAKLSLTSRAIEIDTVSQDRNGVTIRVAAVAIVKVGENDNAIRAAAQRFLGQEKNIDNFTQEVLSGSLRASIGATDVSTIIKERDKLGGTVLDVARESLLNQGLDVDSFEIKGITDDNGYIQDLGRAEQARVRLAAEVAETQAKREAREESVVAEQAIAESENTLALRKAALQLDTDRAAAEAAAAKPLAEAKAQQAVVQEQQVTATRRAELRAAELESEVVAVAEANRRKTELEAEASARRTQLETEAEAAALIRRAEADLASRTSAASARLIEANAERDSRTAAADAVAAEGKAEADAIRAKGDAEAEATKKAAEAVAEQSEALIGLRLIETLPQIARELAAPMGNIDNLTVVSTDGASALTKNVVSGFGELDGTLGAMGLDLKTIIGNVLGGAAAGKAAAVTARPTSSGTLDVPAEVFTK